MAVKSVLKIYVSNPIHTEITVVPDKAITTYKYDMFISSPMGSIKEKEYPGMRDLTLEVIEYMQKECNLKNIFYAGKNIATKDDFDPHDIAIVEYFKSLKDSRHFILIYPRKLASSSIFEAGLALAFGKKGMYFVKDNEHLPFLMRQAEQAFSNIKIYEYRDISDIKKILKSNVSFFDNNAQ